MRTASVSDLRYRFKRIDRLLRQGHQVRLPIASASSPA